jgi:hypothetical protein
MLRCADPTCITLKCLLHAQPMRASCVLVLPQTILSGVWASMPCQELWYGWYCFTATPGGLPLFLVGCAAMLLAAAWLLLCMTDMLSTPVVACAHADQERQASSGTTCRRDQRHASLHLQGPQERSILGPKLAAYL